MGRIYSALPGIPLYQSGVGDGDDLLVRVREDAADGWFPVLRAGTYYVGTERRYLFAQKGTATFTLAAASGSQFGALAVSGLTQDATLFGPVLLWNDAAPRPLKRVTSPLRAFRSVLPAGGPDLWRFTVPGSGILVSLVSDPVTGVLLSVPSSGSIRSTEEYYYDASEGTVFLRGASFPSLWATYLVGERDAELLKQEEILQIDRDGRIRTQLRDVLMDPIPPLIRKPDAGGGGQGTAIAASGNVVTPPGTGFTSGDIVAVEYYVRNSFTAVPTGQFGLAVQYCLALSGSHTLEYETGQDWYDTSRLPSGATDYVQLNPLKIQRESGFLYLVDPAVPYPAPARMLLDVSNNNPPFSTVGLFGIAVAVTVQDAEGQAVPGWPVKPTQILGSGNMGVVYPLDEHTNGKGQVVYAWAPTGSGLVQLSFAVTGTAVSATTSWFARDIGVYERQSELQLGKLLLQIEETPYRDNLYRLAAYYCYADGSPYQAPDAGDPVGYNVTFHCQRSNFFDFKTGQAQSKIVSVPTDDDSVATLLVDPVPGDLIRAYVQTPVTGRIRTATPISIPEGR